MNVPEIDEMLATRNIGNVSQHTFTRWQRALREVILPLLATVTAETPKERRK
jgi:hypothetical protein